MVFGFCLRHQRDLREIYWGFFCADSLSPLACYSPADYADYAEKECSKLHYFAEKDRLVVSEVIGVNVVLGFVCDLSARSARDIGVSFVRID